MSIINLDKIIIFLCIFPAWVFLPDILFYNKLIYTAPFALLIIISYFFLKRKNLKNFRIYLFSFVLTIGVDQNLLLEKKFIKANIDFFINLFSNVYYANLFLLLFIFLIFFLFLKFFKKKSMILIFPFIVVISLFNYYELIFFKIKIQNFDLSKNFTEKIINNEIKKKVLFIILDEMSGINSTESNLENGNKFKNKLNEFAKYNNLILYPNAFSISDNTASSVPAIVNFIDNEKDLVKNRKDNVVKSDMKFYNEYILKKNLLFDKFYSISTLQNIHLNFCNHINVKKCYQFNPYKNHSYFINGYKYGFFTKFLSIWKLQGSISSKLFWRLGREIQISDSFLEPEIHKATFQFMLNEIKSDLISDKFDLVFAHLLVPHVPYGFDSECFYDGKLSLRNTFWSASKKIIQHNQERFCVVYYLNEFFSSIKKKIDYENLEVFILSDHGSRISNSDESKYSSIFINKSKESKFLINQQNIAVHSLVKQALGN
jgi:hypothetical protein